MVQVQFDMEAARFTLPEPFVQNVVNIVQKRGAPTWITRGSVLYDIYGKSRCSVRINRDASHTLHCLRILKDGKVYKYVDDGDTDRSGRRMILTRVKR